MPIYCFYWSDEGLVEEYRILIEINADKETVKKMLDEYRSSDEEGYIIFEFMEFLEERGVEFREISPDQYIYF